LPVLATGLAQSQLGEFLEKYRAGFYFSPKTAMKSKVKGLLSQKPERLGINQGHKGVAGVFGREKTAAAALREMLELKK
jgi:hypothetical protein